MKPDKARGVEDVILRVAQSGRWWMEHDYGGYMCILSNSEKEYFRQFNYVLN
ncbi:hypothetical protein ACS0TY_032535 [Phlomoides rotata]